MKKLLIISFCILAFTSVAFAQKDRSKEIVEKFTKTMNSYANISCDFSVLIENNQLNTKENYDGKVVAEKEKYVLTLNDYEIYTDGTNKWMFLRNENEVNIVLNDPESVDVVENPILFLSSQPKNIRYQQKGQVTENGKKLTVIEYYPKDAKLTPWSYIRLSLDEKDMKPYILYYQGKDGINYTINLKNFVASDIKVPSTYFTFNPANYPDIIITDLRGN